MTFCTLHGRLLAWERDEADTYAVRTPRLHAIVFRWLGRPGYHWEIFFDGEVKHYGQARSLHSALCHVEGNCLGRGMLDELTQEEPEQRTLDAAASSQL